MSIMKTACYARFSSDLQRETSLDDQIRNCREYAERRGWTWQNARIYSDAGISGASIEGRPGLQALMLAAQAPPPPFDVLLVDDSSRISRDLADALRTMQRLKFAGIRVLYLSQGIDSDSEQAETLVAVHGIVDGLYLRELASKIRRGVIGQLERGFSTGATAYGYRSIPVPDPSGRLDPNGHPTLLGKRLDIDQAEADTVRQIFAWYAAGIGLPSIVNRLNSEQVPGPRGGPWRFGAVRRLLMNERLLGRQIWGQRRHERRPGTSQKVAKPRPREEWRIVDRPDLRIVSDDVWAAVHARRAVVSQVDRQPGRTLMRGRDAALHSRHLFSGFMRCGICGGAVTVVCGGHGSPRYGCQRHSKNGVTACSNRLTIRAKIADAAMVAGLQAELLRPDTVSYLSDQLTTALNALNDQRPQHREQARLAKDAAERKLSHLIAAVETGLATPSVFHAIKERETEIRTLDSQLTALTEPLEQRIAVIPTWVRRQLEDAAGLLSETPERAKAEFQRMGIRFTLHPVVEKPGRPFLRAEGSGDFEMLAMSPYAHFTPTDRTHPRSAR